jgi:hypothetical protein
MQLLSAQPWLRRIGLVWLVLPALAFSRSGLRFLQDPQDEPLVSYSTLPGVPSEEMVVEQNEAAKTAANWGLTEAASSALHAEAAENMEEAAASELVTKANEIRLKSATSAALVSAQKAAEMRKRAEASAKRAEAMVAEMPAIAVKAANRAVDSVVHAAIQSMNKEASKVAEAQRLLERKLAREAAKNSQIAAEPFQQAKIRAQQTMVSYLSQARDLANAITHLKLQAPKLNAQARVLQARGDVVHAQEMQIAAHDLFDKAAQLTSQMNSFQSMAGKIQSGLGMFDLSAGAAASYASYTSNPGGGVGYSALPPLPMPLQLVPLKK